MAGARDGDLDVRVVERQPGLVATVCAPNVDTRLSIKLPSRVMRPDVPSVAP
jgi:hypothetical protein